MANFTDFCLEVSISLIFKEVDMLLIFWLGKSVIIDKSDYTACINIDCWLQIRVKWWIFWSKINGCHSIRLASEYKT